MSTKSTIACDDKGWDSPDGWSVCEEMLDDTVWVEVRGGNFVVFGSSVRVQLPPAVIDAIRAAPANAFPHLREKEAKPCA
jgi:hypothetical protein